MFLIYIETHRQNSLQNNFRWMPFGLLHLEGNFSKKRFKMENSGIIGKQLKNNNKHIMADNMTSLIK